MAAAATDVRAEFDQVTLEGLRPAVAGVLLLLAVFVPVDWLATPRAQAPQLVAHDLAIAAASALLWLLLARDRIPARLAAPAGIVFSLLVLSNVLRARGFLPGAASTALVAALIVGLGCLLLSRRWLALGLLLVYGAWLWSVSSAEPAWRVGQLGFTLLGALAVALPMHLARRRSHRRVFEQHGRVDELQQALAAAGEARRSLDAQVAARTDELSRTTAELRRQLQERERASQERLQLEARLQHDALHDALTGLPNRALFLNRLEHAWQRTKREPGFRFAVLYLDLDRFKVINDTFGHEIGDQLLAGIGKRIPACLRPTDTVARLGGDEFAVLLENFSNAAETLAIAARIQGALKQPFRIGAHEIYATASMGIADGVVEGQTPEQYVRDADVAMYAAKSRGTPVERFDGAMHSPALARMRMETELRVAIEREQFFLVYQPIVDLRTTRLEGFEALIRWRHPSRGLVPPDEFIGLAEETRLILPMSLWVLRQASRQAAAWRKTHAGPGPLMGVNLSPLLLTRPGMAEEILEVVASEGLAPGDLAVEVTESAVMAQPLVASAMLGVLRQSGIQVFIDDFGTGYSSLAYLTTLPVDRLKIDRGFVASMGEASRLRVVKTIATLAHDLGKRLVAEGVETPAQLEGLRAMGCEYGQGWLFSRPMDAAQATALLEAEQGGSAFPGLVEQTEEQARLAETARREAATTE